MNGTKTIPGDYSTGIEAIPDPYYYASDETLRHENRISELLELDAQDQEAEAQSGVSHQSGVSQLATRIDKQNKVLTQMQQAKQKSKLEAQIAKIIYRLENSVYWISTKERKFILQYGTAQDVAFIKTLVYVQSYYLQNGNHVNFSGWMTPDNASDY
jgi:hypothetical protein